LSHPPLGNYAVLDVSGVAADSAVALQSVMLAESQREPPYIITFWFHTNGDDPSVLELYEWNGEALSDEPIWTSEGASA
jgi:hypothetical protein